MRNISIVKDKTDGTPFAVIVIDKAKKISAFGSKGQGETWAEWVNSSEMSFDEAVSSLDLSLVAEKPLRASSANTEELAKFMRPEEVLDLQSELNKKALLEIVETKSAEPIQEDYEEDLPDFTPVSEWPITDVEIASIDVLYKQNAVDYKAKAFIAEKNISSLMYEVKGYRAIWDPNISSWRCPTDTANGGEFTNRMGRGCTTGMVRRLGQFLMSVDDRNTVQPKLPGMDDTATVLSRAGKLINSRAEASREKFVDKTKNRAARRQKRTNLNPRFTDLYGALNPDKPALTRARTAAGLRLQRAGGNIAQGGFAQMEASGKRKARRLKKSQEAKFPGGAAGKKLREFGGIIPNSRLGGYVSTNDNFGKPKFIDLNEMTPNPSFLKRIDWVLDEKGKEIPNPIKGFDYITRREAAEVIRQHQTGLLVRFQGDTTNLSNELGYFQNEIDELLLTPLQSSNWDSISTGKKTDPDFKFLDYDELQKQKAKYAKGSTNSGAKHLTQELQGFEDLEKLDPSDSRITGFKSRMSNTFSFPRVTTLSGGDGETYIVYPRQAKDSPYSEFLESQKSIKKTVSVVWNKEKDVTVRRNNPLSVAETQMDTVTTRADHYDDDGEYLFTTVHSVSNGGTQDNNDMKTDFYVLASKPSQSVVARETKKSVKDGEISEHFRLHGGKNPLTNRGGFISTARWNPIDLDEMIDLDRVSGFRTGTTDYYTEVSKQIREWRDKGWKHVSRDEWHDMENRILQDVGKSRKDTVFASENNPSNWQHGLGGDSPVIKQAFLGMGDTPWPDTYVRAFSAKDFQHMLDVQNSITMSHENDEVWKKAIRRKEKESGKDKWGNDVGSDESRLSRIRQNLADFIESFDPLADDDVKSRRMRRRVEKRSSKAEKNSPNAANANDAFGEPGEEGKLNIAQLLSWHRSSMDNFSSDLRNRGNYQGTNDANEALFCESNQIAGNASFKFEGVKKLIDSILDDNDVFGADPEAVRNSSSSDLTGRLMQEASSYAHEEGFQDPLFPLISLTNFRLIEKTDGLGTKKVAVRELVTVTPYMMASYLDEKQERKFENGIFSLGIHTTELSDLTDDEIAKIESGEITFDHLRDRFTDAAGGRATRSAFRRGFPDDGTELNIFFDRSGDPLLIDGESRARIPYRGSKNEKIDIISNGVSGKITTPKGAELEASDTLSDLDGGPIDFWNNNKKRQKRKPGRRSNTGVSPETPGVIERFLTGEGRRWAREKEAGERLEQGRMPRSTDSVTERFFKRLARLSNRLNDQADPIDLYPTIPSRVNAPDRRTRVNGPDAIWNVGFRREGVIEQLREFPVPPNQNKQAWKDEPDNVRRIADLSDSLEVLGGFRPRITQEDRDREAELREMKEEWEMDFHNPDKPTLPGSDSNFDHAIVAADPSPNYGRIVVYDTRPGHWPAAAVIDENTGTTHLLGKDGKHLMSIVETEDVNGNRITVPIIGPGARSQFDERERIPGFIEKMTGKFRKRKPRVAVTSVNPERLKRRGVVRSKSDRTGISYPQRSKGDYLQSLDGLFDSQKKLMTDKMSAQFDSLEKEFRKVLKLSDTDELLEDDILDHIDDLAKSGNGRLSGMRKSALHDMLVLADARESGDLMLVNDLKPLRRNEIIKEAGIVTGVNIEKSRPFTPYGPTRPAAAATSITPSPGRTSYPRVPADFDPATRRLPPRSPRVVTGPALTPGVGNPTLNISFSKNGTYVDDTTGELIEDLSGLDVSPDMVYTPYVVDADGWFPSIPLQGSIQGMTPRRVTKIAPGVDPNNPDISSGTDPRRVVQVSDVTQTFDEAGQALEDANMLIGRPVALGYAEDAASLGFDAAYNRDTATLRAALRNSAAQNGLYKDLDGLIHNVGSSLNHDDIVEYGLGAPGPVRDMYVPGLAVDEASAAQFKAAVVINQALHAQNVADEMERLLGTTGRTEISAWEAVWGSSASGFHASSADLDISVDNVRKARERADDAWATAATELADIQQLSANRSNTALLTMRLTGTGEKPIGDAQKAQLNEYVRNGQTAEMAEHLLRKHILSDPSVMEGLAIIKREKMEFAAKRTNARMRARANRTAVGRRAVGQLDEVEDAAGIKVLDIHGEGQVSRIPNGQRSVQEIMDIHTEHRADGALEPPTIDPATGIVQEGILDDEDIEMLSMMGRAHSQWANDKTTAGHPALVGTNWPDNAGPGQMMMGSWWQYSGYSSLPLLVDEPEIISLLDETAPDGKPFAIAITRGVKADGNLSAPEMVNQGLRGDRFVPGQGMSATGRGEYWTGELSAWPSYHSNDNGSFIAVLTRDSKIMTAQVADELFTGFVPHGGGNESLLYGALWSLANAHGAPDFGHSVNTAHGNSGTFGVQENSLLPDPNTGLYDIPALQAVVDKMTDLTPGQEGIATLEGWNNAGKMPTWLSNELFPGRGVTPEIAQEAQELRQEWNAWLGQHLSWFVQIAQMAQDESQPGQAGVDAKEWNKKLNEARRTLLYMGRENRLATMGYDAAVSGDSSRQMQKYALPSSLWTGADGLATNKKPNVILIFNRSSGIYYRLPTNWKAFRDRVNNSLTNKLPW